MRILVIDDSPIHQESARQTLGGYTLTVAKSYDEAYVLLNGDWRRDIPPAQVFDVVLSDLLMPASEMTMGEEGKKYAGQEMPVGFALSLMAALRGVKHVAVVTDTNHHDHPASAMLDPFASRCTHEHDSVGMPVRFVINGAKVGYYHSPLCPVDGTTCSDCGGTGQEAEQRCPHCHGSGKNTLSWVEGDVCAGCKGSGRYTPSCPSCDGGKLRGKDWGLVLQHLLQS